MQDLQKDIEVLRGDAIQLAQEAMDELSGKVDAETSVRDLISIFNVAVKTYRDVTADLNEVEKKKNEGNDGSSGKKLLQQKINKYKQGLNATPPKTDN